MTGAANLWALNSAVECHLHTLLREGKSAIVSRLERLLAPGVRSEAEVVYRMAEVRKLLEQQAQRSNSHISRFTIGARRDVKRSHGTKEPQESASRGSVGCANPTSN